MEEQEIELNQPKFKVPETLPFVIRLREGTLEHIPIPSTSTTDGLKANLPLVILKSEREQSVS
jgi:hypothetical protein